MMGQIHAECKDCLDKQNMRPRADATHYAGTCTRCNQQGLVYDVRDTEYVRRPVPPPDGGMVAVVWIFFAGVGAFILTVAWLICQRFGFLG